MLFARSLVLVLLVSAGAHAANNAPPSVRWTEGASNCTIRTSDDGHTYYGLSSGDFEVTLAVDAQELAKVPHRAVPMLGVRVMFHYRGTVQFDVQQNNFSLEFVKHFHVVQSSLDPDGMVKNLQQNIDDLTDEVERHQVKKHPETKEQQETELQLRLKDYTEMMDFISTQALRPSTLDAANSSVSGWVFFSTKNRWIGPWRRPEQFILRLPVENVMVEFPFELPPKHGQVELRHRE